MPMYRITSPDGSTYEVTAPDGASEQYALDYVQKNQQTLSPVKPQTLAAQPTTQPVTAPAPQPAAAPDKTWGEAIMGDAKNSGIGRTGFDQGMQGMTFGFADEVQDRIGALIASKYTGEKYDDMLNMAREASKARLAQQMDQRPALSIGANVVGGLLTGGAGAETGAGKIVAAGLRSGNKATRIASTIGTGAVQGALYGTGSANDGERGEGALKGGALGVGAGIVAPMVGRGLANAANYVPSIVKGALAKAPDQVHDVADALKKIAGGNYQKMRDAGAIFNDTAANDLITGIRKGIDSNEFIPELNPKTLAIINKIEDRATDPKGGGLTLSELDQYRRLLGRVGATEDGVSSGSARKAIDDFVTNAHAGHLTSGDPVAMKTLLQGRKQYAQASKYEDIADIYLKADGDPAKIKRGLTRFIEVNGNKPAGWSDAEAKALRRAASTNTSEALLRFVGKAGFDIGGSKMVGNITGGTAGFFLSGGNPVVPVVGTAAKEAYKLGTRGQATQLLKMLEQGPQNPGFMPQVYNAAQPYAGTVQRSLTNSAINQMMPGMTPQASPLKRFY